MDRARYTKFRTLPPLPIGDEAAVYADKGYDSAARHARLAERGVFDGIMRRGHRHRPLTPDEVARNRSLVPIRSAIERVFGTPTGADLELVCKARGAAHELIADRDTLIERIQHPGKGIRVLEVRVERSGERALVERLAEVARQTIDPLD